STEHINFRTRIEKSGNADDLIRSDSGGTHAFRDLSRKPYAGPFRSEITLQNWLMCAFGVKQRTPQHFIDFQERSRQLKVAWPVDQLNIFAGQRNSGGQIVHRAHNLDHAMRQVAGTQTAIEIHGYQAGENRGHNES